MYYWRTDQHEEEAEEKVHGPRECWSAEKFGLKLVDVCGLGGRVKK